MNKIKALDFMTAGVVFASAVNELVSWIRCRNEVYNGPVQGSEYLIHGYPEHATLQGLLFAFFLIFMILKFRACIYTKIVVYIFAFLQTVNYLALVLRFGFDFYDKIVYPIFLFSIIFLFFLKVIRWGSQRRS